MTTSEAINYENKVLEAAKEWVHGNNSIDNTIELAIIAEHYNVKLPACMHHFQYSDSPGAACCTGAYKTIFKVLDKLKNAIETF